MRQYTPCTKAPILYGSSYVSYLAQKNVEEKEQQWTEVGGGDLE